MFSPETEKSKPVQFELTLAKVENVKKKESCRDFDDLLKIIGSEGRYQRLLTYAFLGPLIILAPMLELNAVFLFDVPDHWCHVPGNEATTYDLDTWKNLTLPMEKGPDGDLRYSQCSMFDQTQLSRNANATIPCQFGWDFDKSDYESTIPSAYLWVCNDAENAANAIASGSAGAAVGTMIFGLLADKIGRLPVFFMCVGVNIVFRGLCMLVPQYVTLHHIFWFLSCTAFGTMYTVPSLAIAEVSGPEYRSWIYAVVWMVWVIGNCLMPYLAWVARDWYLFAILTTSPAILIFVYCPILLESPRWLLTVGRSKEAKEIVCKIAKINGKSVQPKELENMVDEIIVRQQKKGTDSDQQRTGFWTLFQRKRLAINTILLCIAWSMNTLLYYGIILNTVSLEGNRFLNYFLLSLIELPSGYLAGVLVEKTGRRWTQVCFFGMCFISCVICTFAVLKPELSYLVITGALGIKFGVTVTSLVVYLQGAEIFPTPLRSTGSALATTFACIVGITGPYVVFTGKFNASMPYMIFGVVSIIGGLAAALLPETLNQHLPETVEDADNFGRNTAFWSYLPKEARRRRSSSILPDK